MISNKSTVSACADIDIPVLRLGDQHCRHISSFPMSETKNILESYRNFRRFSSPLSLTVGG